MIREKLIQILEVKESLEYAYSSGNEPVVADDILSELRCDKCKHWTAPTEEWMQGLGECTRLRDPRDGSSNVGANGGYLFTCPADFFCALWEAK